MLAPNIGLIPIDRACAALITRKADEFDEQHHVDSSGVREQLAAVVKMTPKAILDAGEWGTFFLYDRDTRQVAGSCGFKSPPTRSGKVEIAYFTFPPHEGKGFATAAVNMLVALALESIDVAEVIAHTLPEPNASTHVLEKCAFVRAGDYNDPEDGAVWRWRYGP
jgi:RimJ/RimL family protein N-acetyltransferase